MTATAASPDRASRAATRPRSPTAAAASTAPPSATATVPPASTIAPAASPDRAPTRARGDDDPLRSDHLDRLARSAAGQLKQFDQIAGWILDENLGAAGPGHHIVAELDTGAAQPVDLRRQVLDDQMDAVPAARARSLPIAHRSSGRARWAAEQQPQ